MKKIFLFLYIALPVLHCFGQQTSLSENFNAGCPAGAGGPAGWNVYNIVPGTSEGSWKCYPSAGRAGTPGITCSGLFGDPLIYHLDTSILVSPKLDFSNYPGSIYINFDSKTTNFSMGSKIGIYVSQDSTMGADASISSPIYGIEEADAMSPVFGSGDETDWVTHHANLTSFKHVVPLYVGFRYVSAAGINGSRWFLDNINSTTTPYTAVSDINGSVESLSFTGASEGGKLTLSCFAPVKGNYTLSVYDLAGRVVHTQQLLLQTGHSFQTVQGHNLANGLYILKMANESSFSTTKVYIW